MATVQFEGISLTYPGAPAPAVDDLNLEIADGEFLVLVGPSGCGKSTSLRMLAGLEAVTSGRIHIGGKDVTGLPPRSRDVAMVFQSYALYPNMTVAENMGFALRNAGVSKADTMVRVKEAAAMLELEELLDRKPAKLSGGQRQRVAMGRAIVRRPQVFCMDEPLSNLDAKLRVSTRSQIAALQKRLGTTTVYVTHDQVEAMTMGHRVAVLKDGKLQQVAAPRDLYDDPINTFVAGFIGSPGMNLLTAPVENGSAVLNDLRIPVPRTITDKNVIVGIRPESWEVTTNPSDSLAVEVELLEELGSESFLYSHGITDAWSSRSGRIVARVDRRFQVALGDRLRLTPKPEEVFFFDAKTELRLR
ncbi:sn-glycerol-3-phosphate ABC transporter ATP-binding protein UgpC [Nocardia sp. NPDC051030]|uniref:ABC transporter ATP-binding protein n=1 Tax=Nocardia sp. NPDC051030 TaxID=3155162 RepID=UPI003412DAF3